MFKELAISKAGYVYLYLSNDNTALFGAAVEVFFDDFTVEHVKSPVVQQDDYYPFGLTFNSHERENSTVNKWKFQGQEHVTDLDLGWDSFKWRNHMPDIGRFFNVDPLTDKYVYNSPYAFSENHVVAHRELEGLEKISIHTQSFIPYKTLGATGEGGKYKGDNRGFGQPGASRISTRVDVDLNESKVVSSQVSGALTYGSDGKPITYSDADGILAKWSSGKNSLGLAIKMAGNNDAVPVSPDIDVMVHLNLTTTRNDDGSSSTRFKGEVRGDKFPANETFVTDECGDRVFLGVSGADGDPLKSLPFDNQREMSSFDFQINYDKYGGATGVTYQDKTYTVDEWNKKFTKKNAKGDDTTEFK